MLINITSQLILVRSCSNLNFLQAMSGYGFEIVQTLIVDIEPDEHVKRAMNEINAGTVYVVLSISAEN